jgi:hypothetical protein
MSVIVRIPRALYKAIITDLTRPHAFAAERVGFLFTRPGRSSDGRWLALAVGYEPVAEEHYTPTNDPWIGVEINSGGIRAAMQHILNTGEGAFHVHLHEHYGAPRFSSVDLRDLPPMVASFQYVGRQAVHGGLVLSWDSATALAWEPGQSNPATVEKITVVGFPLAIFPCTLPDNESEVRDDH